MSDLISRQDAIKVIKDNSFAPGVDYLEINGYGAIDDIRALPSAGRPQGRNLSEEYPSLFECSVCGASCDDTYPWDCDIKFCPNCGADMRKESE